MHRRLRGRRSAAQLVATVQPGEAVQLLVDGVAVAVFGGATVLDACDAAGRYVPRLCFYPDLARCKRSVANRTECGLCAVRLGDGSIALACAIPAVAEMTVATDDPGLRAFAWNDWPSFWRSTPISALPAPIATAAPAMSARTGIRPRRGAATNSAGASWASWWHTSTQASRRGGRR